MSASRKALDVLYKARSFGDKNVEHQFFEFLTGRSFNCVISQFEWPLTTSYRVSNCVFFSREQLRRAAAAVN
jgi:hypothetical protein